MSDLDFQSKDYTAENIIIETMTDFGIAVAADKVASYIDGLKAGYRRILWAARDQLTYTVLSQFYGKVLENHPVGDKSITDACIRSMQDYSIGMALLDGHGNAGSYDSDDAGAPRYLKVKLGAFAKDVYFEGVNLKTIPVRETENFMGIEPVHLIPRLPMSLILYSHTLGTGFKTESFPRNLENVCILVEKFLDAKSQGKPFEIEKYAQLLLPDFPIMNTIRDAEQVVAEYRKGKHSPPMTVEGRYDLTPTTMVIRTSPFCRPFPRVTDRLISMLKDKKSWLYDLVTGYENLSSTDTEGALSITIKRTADIFDVAYRLARELELTKVMRERPMFVARNGGLAMLSPQRLIDLWYKIRRESVISGIRYDQIALTQQIIERRTKLLVADRWEEVQRIVRDRSLGYEGIISTLMDTFDLSQMQSKILANTPIIAGNVQTRAAIQDEIEAAELKAVQLKNSHQDTESVIFRDIEYFRKKYRRPRRTRIDPYMGYVCIKEKDIHQFESIDECKTILKNFPDSQVHMYLDPDKLHPRTYVANGGVSKTRDTVLPRIFRGERVLELPVNSKVFTVCITDENASIANEIVLPKDGVGMIVGDKFTGIFSDGTVDRMTYRDLVQRRGSGKRGTRSDLSYVIPAQIGDCVLFHMNKLDETSLNVSLINADTKKIPMSLMERTEFLGIVPLRAKTQWLLNLPKWSTGSYKFVVIENISKVIGDKTNVVIKLGRKMSRDYDLGTAIVL